MIRLRSSIALILLYGVVVKCESNEEQNVYTNAVRSPGSKTKKIQIVYIKVPLSKVLESPNNGYNNAERGYNEGGGGSDHNYSDGSNSIPGEGRLPNYNNINNNNMGVNGYNGGPNYGDNNYASNQNSYDSIKPNVQNGPDNTFKGPPLMFGQQEEASNIDPFGNAGQKHQMNYQNDANLGTAYGAAVGNALPQNTNFDDSVNYGQESQSGGFSQNNQINYEQNSGYAPNPPYRPQNDGFEQITQNGNDGFGEQNYDQRKIRKGNQPFTKMMANFRPPIPIMTTIPMFSMKGMSSPSFGSNFPSFGGQSFGNIGGMPAVSGISGISGITGGIKGFGGIKSKLSMLLGNKFGMGGAGGLLGGMMGWD